MPSHREALTNRGGASSRRSAPRLRLGSRAWDRLDRPSDLDRQNLGHPLGDRLQGVCAPRALPPPEDALPALCMVGLSRGPSRVPQSKIKTTLRATQAQQVLNFVPIPTVYVHPIRLNPYSDSDVVVPLGSSRQRKLAFLMGTGEVTMAVSLLDPSAPPSGDYEFGRARQQQKTCKCITPWVEIANHHETHHSHNEPKGVTSLAAGTDPFLLGSPVPKTTMTTSRV